MFERHFLQNLMKQDFPFLRFLHVVAKTFTSCRHFHVGLSFFVVEQSEIVSQLTITFSLQYGQA
jgi:hypothetical protein